MPEEYRWVTRHPAESWREHYRNKKNKDRLDAMIEQFRNEEPPMEEQLYLYDRKLNAVRFTNADEDSPTDNEPETYDDYWSRREAREKSRSGRSRKAVAEEEEESDSNEEPSGDEDGAPEHHHPRYVAYSYLDSYLTVATVLYLVSVSTRKNGSIMPSMSAVNLHLLRQL